MNLKPENIIFLQLILWANYEKDLLKHGCEYSNSRFKTWVVTSMYFKTRIHDTTPIALFKIVSTLLNAKE